MHTTVADIVDASGQWRWPAAWYDLFPVLINLQPPSLVHNVPNKPTWKDLDGKDSYFSSKEVWNNIRSRGDTVSWFNMIWFSQCIPRHSFHMWLVVRNKLKTQDRLMTWEAGSATNLRLMCCPLCRYDRDSRDHLFFQCSFASQVWNNVKTMVTLENVSDSWASICAWMERTASSKTTNVIVGKILIAATTYFIWQERSARLFSHNHKSAEVVTELVKHTVRLKLMGFKFRGSADRNRVLKAWKIYSNEDEFNPG
ncbi:putative reverse transcriptase zinc-binding domain-containing protein [Helianthus annuus]|nr:putative reverse transcriptase zinc-binding domain-containing protein [Helianthus annuus]